MVNEPFSRGDEPIDKGLWSLYKPSNGFNLTQEDMEKLLSAVKSQAKESTTSNKLNNRFNKSIAIEGEGQDKYLVITDEDGMIGFAPLP